MKIQSDGCGSMWLGTWGVRQACEQAAEGMALGGVTWGTGSPTSWGCRAMWDRREKLGSSWKTHPQLCPMWERRPQSLPRPPSTPQPAGAGGRVGRLNPVR